jgi:cell division protein FtsW
VIRDLSTFGLVIAMALIALTRIPGLGVTRNGQTNWLALGPLQLQPSEIAKLAVILWAAHIYANKERRLGELQHLIVPVVPGMALVAGLVVLQRDLGTALVLFAIMLGMLWVVGAPMRLFALALSVIGVGAFYMATTSAERRERLLSFLDPFKDYHDSGWQPAHGLYALSTGGVFGQGIGASQQKWGDLPEAHTDYIFAVLGEELGLIGTLLVLALFLTIAYAAVRVATQTRDPFVRYTSFGITIWLLGQMIINVGMVLALLPVIGIPLPLVSYGGSALLPSLVALGLLIGFARSEPEAARALAARKRLRSAGISAKSRRSH